MSKIKILTGAGIIAAGSMLSQKEMPDQTAAELERQAQFAKEILTTRSKDQNKAVVSSQTSNKRTPSKVYHRFEDIPAISDDEATLYDRSEYTYIADADLYSKKGQLKLKRVLTDEVSRVNVLSLVYRSECGDYTPRPEEDQLAKYNIDLKLLSKTGMYKGPSQMNDDGVLMFVRYLAADPESRKYVQPLLSCTNGSLKENLQQLENKYFDKNGKLRPMSERDAILTDKTYQSIRFKDNAWRQLASPKLKKFIAQEEAKRRTHFTNTTKNYLCLTEMFPNKETFIRKLEDFNLSVFSLGRVGRPKHVMTALARSMNLKDEKGNLNATRIPLVAIAASISHINWRGNGKAALSLAQKKLLSADYELQKKQLFLRIKTWVTGKSRLHGVDELARLNMITPTHIRQYAEIELPGAEKLAQEYQKLVDRAENQVRLAAARNKIQTAQLSAENLSTKTSKRAKTLQLTPADFHQTR